MYIAKMLFGDLCNNTMKPLFIRYLRGAVLGMMLLLSGMAGMVCFSYDADGDDSTPPVTVEFNGVVPSKKGIQVSSPRSSTVAQHVGNVQPASTELLASVNYLSIPATDMDKGSPQLVVPLRR
ncbi:MAG: hypothetical protein LAO76_12355 [Acidobacteriia bacterium]|nr:hypothetical protein [Terriglobia bacterium]